jgi:hypothetical protein
MLRLLAVIIMVVTLGCQSSDGHYNSHKAGNDHYNRPTCPVTEVLAFTSEPWSDRDQSGYRSARQRCGAIFPNSPCLIRFTRMEQGRYRAICGGRR